MECEKPQQESEDCTRIRRAYRGKNLYIVVSPTRIDLSMANSDQFITLAGLALIERLSNELLARGMDLEELSGICFECSYMTSDLPGLLSAALVAKGVH